MKTRFVDRLFSEAAEEGGTKYRDVPKMLKQI
jgi:hypothetical protein